MNKIEKCVVNIIEIMIELHWSIILNVVRSA
jgi:hypothetical protein